MVACDEFGRDIGWTEMCTLTSGSRPSLNLFVFVPPRPYSMFEWPFSPLILLFSVKFSVV